MERERARGGRSTVRLAALAGVVLVLLSVLAPSFGAAVATAASSDAIHYVTDSGFEVVDASGGAALDGNPFTDADTLALPGITLSAAGNAGVTLDQRTGPMTKLSGIDSNPNVTVNPDDKQAVVLVSGLDSLTLGDVDYGSTSATDLSYTATTTATLTLNSTGLSKGTTVEALDAATDDRLASATVDSQGSVTFTDLPSGTHTVSVAEKTDSGGGGGSGGRSSSSETPTPTETATETGNETETPTPTETESSNGSSNRTDASNGTATATTEPDTASQSTPAEGGVSAGSTESPTATPRGTDANGPGFGLHVALSALTTMVLLVRRQIYGQ